MRGMKVATWNVNGIRARQAQVREWMERERPDVLRLQEIKAAPEQAPPEFCEMEGCWCQRHGGPKGYSGVGLHVREGFFSAATVHASGARGDRRASAVLCEVHAPVVAVFQG